MSAWPRIGLLIKVKQQCGVLSDLFQAYLTGVLGTCGAGATGRGDSTCPTQAIFLQAVVQASLPRNFNALPFGIDRSRWVHTVGHNRLSLPKLLRVIK